MKKWSSRPIGELCRLVNGRAFKPSDWTDEGLPIVRIQNLNDQLKPFNHYNGPVDPKVLIDSGAILLSWSGTPGTSFGCFFWNRGRGILNQHIFGVHVDEAKIDREFFVYAVNSKLDEMIALAHGGVGLRHITKGKLEGIHLPMPPIKEQRRIAARVRECMDRIGELRELRTATGNDARRLEAAMFHDFILAGAKEGKWPTVTLGEITVSSKYGTSAKATKGSTGTPVLRMGNIVDGCLDYSDLKYINLPYEELAKYQLSLGDILINRTNSLELVGKAAAFDQTDGKWVYASYLVCVRVDRSRAIPEYITAVINSNIGREFVLRTARRAIGMVNINAREIGRFPIPLPKIKQQQAVVNKLAEVREAAQQIRSGISAPDADQLIGAVLRKAFAGEL